jgi:hypothetical protein
VVIDVDVPQQQPILELLRSHGHAGSDHAFFFGPVPIRTKTLVLLRCGGGATLPRSNSGTRWSATTLLCPAPGRTAATSTTTTATLGCV